MLTLFIPQNCDGQICSITQNIENENRYHRMALSWNKYDNDEFCNVYI